MEHNFVFGPTVVAAFLSPPERRAKPVSILRAVHTMLFWANGRWGVSLPPGASGQVSVGPRGCTCDFGFHGGDSCGVSTSVALCRCIWHRVWPFRALWGHSGHSTPIELARRVQCSNVAPGGGSLRHFFGPVDFGAFLSPRASIGPCRCQSLGTRT